MGSSASRSFSAQINKQTTNFYEKLRAHIQKSIASEKFSDVVTDETVSNEWSKQDPLVRLIKLYDNHIDSGYIMFGLAGDILEDLQRKSSDQQG